MKEVLFKQTYEQVGIENGHSCAHSSYLDLEVMLGLEGEVFVGGDMT